MNPYFAFLEDWGINKYNLLDQKYDKDQKTQEN